MTFLSKLTWITIQAIQLIKLISMLLIQGLSVQVILGQWNAETRREKDRQRDIQSETKTDRETHREKDRQRESRTDIEEGMTDG